MKLYMILNKATCSQIRNSAHIPKAVKETEVQHDAHGGVLITDILKTMGYQMEGTFGGGMYAILPKSGPMYKEFRYNIDDLKLIIIDTETGIIC